MNYIIIFFISFTITALATPYIINLFNKKGITDKPEERKIHSSIIPRMGGIIFYPIILLLLISYYSDLNSLRFFLLSSLILLFSGIWDDVVDIKWYKKASIHSIAVLFLILQLIPSFKSLTFFGFLIPYPIAIVILFFFILGTINSINLMDGLDGLVSGYSILVFLSMAFISYYNGDSFVILISVGMLGSLIAFLRYNSYPASIFLGDTGSILLGLLIVYSSLLLAVNHPTGNLDLTFPVLLLGVPIIDTLKVMLLRIFELKNPFLPDRKHLHHLIIGNNIRQKTAVFIIHLITIPFIINAYFYFRYGAVLYIILFIGISLLLLSTKIIVHIQHKMFLNIKTQFLTLFDFRKLFVPFFRNILIPVSFICFLIFLLLSVGYIRSANVSMLFLLLAIGVILLSISIWHESKKTSQTLLYVFFNFAFILLCNQYYNSDQFNYVNLLSPSGTAIRYLFYFFSFFVFLFISLRDKLLSKEDNFLNGTDLFLVAGIILLFLLEQIVNYQLNEINFNLLFTLILYFWFKIFALLNNQTSKILYYSLFAVNIFTLILSLIINL